MAGLTCSGISLLFFGPAPFIPAVTPSFWLTITTQASLAVSLGPVIVSSMKCIVIGTRELGFEDDRKSASLISGIVCSATSLGTFCGPVLGGVLTEYFGYKYAMALGTIWIMAPMVCFTPYLCLREWQRRSDTKNKLKDICQQTDQETDAQPPMELATVRNPLLTVWTE
ncbi:MFS-type transporter SLC18B1-like [Haliotis rubra]|uniref:MFS-type transporter SLC18B1-like n=1 Tax=Haliotis rubra TaxID=36100 RepID=UPI001EE5360F|nr:MFS-type transporter SLC18B1-like [Haliotis rubra]